MAESSMEKTTKTDDYVRTIHRLEGAVVALVIAASFFAALAWFFYQRGEVAADLLGLRGSMD